jgi:hypothetical protein
MADSGSVGSWRASRRCSVQGSSARRPRAGAAAVPGQHRPGRAVPEGARREVPPPDGDRALAAPREIPALPVPRSALAPAAPLPAELLPGARAGGLRTRTPVQPDTVVFTAACPACGQDCVWSEEREDTRLNAVVTCPCGA